MSHKTKTLNTMIDNFINGNITTARKQAKRFNLAFIRTGFIEIGYSFEKAQLIADFLKTGDGFQAACDAE